MTQPPSQTLRELIARSRAVSKTFAMQGFKISMPWADIVDELANALEAALAAQEAVESLALCGLCGDADGTLFLHARCHLTAPLMARKEGDWLILTCYLPTCGREVARLQLAPGPPGPPLPAAARPRESDPPFGSRNPLRAAAGALD